MSAIEVMFSEIYAVFAMHVFIFVLLTHILWILHLGVAMKGLANCLAVNLLA